MLAKVCTFISILFLLLCVALSFGDYKLASLLSGYLSFSSAIIVHEELK